MLFFTSLQLYLLTANSGPASPSYFPSISSVTSLSISPTVVSALKAKCNLYLNLYPGQIVELTIIHIINSKLVQQLAKIIYSQKFGFIKYVMHKVWF